MSEHEIRAIIRQLCEELDATAREVVRSGMRKVVLPSALGAGIVLGCTESQPLYGAPMPDASNAADAAMADAAPGSDAQMPPPDAAPADAPAADAEGEIDGGPIPPYMAPPDAGPEPLYMAVDVDAGPAPEYMAPDD